MSETIAAFRLIAPALEKLLQAQIAFNETLDAMTASFEAALPYDAKSFVDRMRCAGWSRDEAWEYMWTIPDGTHWLYPTPRPSSSPPSRSIA